MCPVFEAQLILKFPSMDLRRHPLPSSGLPRVHVHLSISFDVWTHSQPFLSGRQPSHGFNRVTARTQIPPQSCTTMDTARRPSGQTLAFDKGSHSCNKGLTTRTAFDSREPGEHTFSLWQASNRISHPMPQTSKKHLAPSQQSNHSSDSIASFER